MLLLVKVRKDEVPDPDDRAVDVVIELIGLSVAKVVVAVVTFREIVSVEVGVTVVVEFALTFVLLVEILVVVITVELVSEVATVVELVNEKEV